MARTGGKVRLDRLLVERGLAPTREKARRLVLAGEVLVDDVPVTKPGTAVAAEASVRLRRPRPAFVGRGGDKLAGALADLGLSVRGRRVLDIGASTGGFTECLLREGAAEVTALDVGRGQLDWKLRTDPRVRVREGVNARYLKPEDFPGPFDLVTIDVSFIGAAKILPAAARLVGEGGRLLVLVKPQFELEREDVGPGGIVRDPALHARAIEKVGRAGLGLGLAVEAVVASRLRGAEGNREFFVLLRRGGAGPGLDEAGLAAAARRAALEE